MPALGLSRAIPHGRDRLLLGGQLLAEADEHLQVRILGPLGPPTVGLAVPPPKRELMQKRPKRFQSGTAVAKAAVDLTTVQKPVVTSKQTPVQAVAHPISPERRVRPR